MAEPVTVVSIDPQGQLEGPVHLHVQLVTTLKISAAEARRRVNRRILEELTTGLSARAAELAISATRINWRVPVMLSLPNHGDIGQVGSILVDATSGEVLTSKSELDHIMRMAEMLHAGATSPAK
jgi:hypothetical protein